MHRINWAEFNIRHLDTDRLHFVPVPYSIHRVHLCEPSMIPASGNTYVLQHEARIKRTRSLRHPPTLGYKTRLELDHRSTHRLALT